MKTVCELNKCAGCMACIDICPKGAIVSRDELYAYNAVIQEDKCVGCNSCYAVCQKNQTVDFLKPNKWYQGWHNDLEVRKRSSSGGVATAIMSAFIEHGGIVCSCSFEAGKFGFDFVDNQKELSKFSGSKYVKSNPKGIYRKVKDFLKKGQKILFIGLPCQVSALKNYVEPKFRSELYTIDLICHGTPSPTLLKKFLEQYDVSLEKLEDIQFRVKAKFMVYGDYKGIITNGVSDKYSIAFLNSLIYTENCYTCQYARKERISDLTLGDSWGSELPVEEQKKGISLILQQSEKGGSLLEMANIHLEKVNLNNAIANNHQLEHPSVMPTGRKQFFQHLHTKKFNKLVFRQLPKQCMRQNIKQILIQLKLLRVEN